MAIIHTYLRTRMQADGIVMIRNKFFTGLSFILFTLGGIYAAIAQPNLVEQNKDWAVFNSDGAGNKVCFIISQPKSYDPMPVSRHGDVFFYVSRRPADGVEAEPSLKVGYEFKPDSKVNVSVDGKDFPFMTTKQYAFPDDGVSLSSMVGTMRAGSDMKVTGVSARGTKVTYSFSLSGVTASYNKLDDACK